MVSPALTILMILGASVGAGRIVAPVLIGRAPVSLQIINYRGIGIPAIGGMAIALAVIVGLIPFLPPIDGLARTNGLQGSSFATAAVALSLSLLGFVDDLGNSKAAKGFRGHLRELAHGRVTGGIVKAAGGLVVGFAAGLWWETTLQLAILDAFLIALTANLVNLLDLRPARACKIFLVAWVPLAAVAIPSPYLFASAPVVGGALAWLPFDLKEKGTLGDSGSNLLGGVLGLGVAFQLSLIGKVAVLAVLVALNLLSERVSFTEVFSRISALRWFDNLGRMRKGDSKS